MVLLKHLLVSSLAVFGAQAASAVLDLIPDNFDKVVLKSGKPSLVEFFAPWCGHCKNLAPIYEELAGEFDSSKKVNIAKVDADAHKDLGKRFGIQGFPTLKWFDGTSDEPEDYKGGRDIDSLRSFVQEKSGVKGKAKPQAPSNVEMLTDDTFSEKIGGHQDVLVAITAPWCGHCKSLAPTWETLANDFASESNILIAKVDAEAANAKATAQNLEIKSYPTIKFYPRGSKTAEDYMGGRSEQDFVTFLNSKTGTHRAAGGGLDGTAGLIPSLDEIVAKYVSGGQETLDSFSKETEKAAKGLKDKYAEYYVKVFGKIEKNKDYAEKELKRLTGIQSKGNLLQEKMDDLTTRSNILRRFIKPNEDKSEL